AHLPGELSEPGRLDHHGLLHHRQGAARRDDPAERVHGGRRRDHPRHHRVRRAVQLQRGSAPGERRALTPCHPASPHDARREDHRPPLGRGSLQGDDRRPGGQAGRRRVRGHRCPVQPRVRHPHGGDLFRAARGTGREGARPGLGTTAVFNSWITKDVRLTVPETVKVVVRGRKPDNVTAKDFMLEILRHPYVKSGRAIGKLVEYCGDAVESLSVDERATMTNMTAEVGGFTGYVAPDDKTVAYLMEYRGITR